MGAADGAGRRGPGFGARATSGTATEAGRALAEAIVSPIAGDDQQFVDVLPVGPGWMARLGRVSGRGASVVVVDPAGVVAAVVNDPGGAVINVEPLAELTLTPLIVRTATFLGSLGMTGRVVCDVHARGFSNAVLQAQGQGAIELTGRTYRSSTRVVAAIGGADVVRRTAVALALDLARDAGIAAFG